MELGFSPLEDPHAGYLVEDSDLEYSDCCDENSSADEETRTHDIESRKKGQPGASQSCKEGSDDEFEREMEAEACLILQQAAATTPATTSAAGSSQQPYDGAKGTSSSSKKEFYNEVYFDSSDEEEEHDGRGPESSTNDGRHKVKKLTNDELFYDPQLDEEDEKWVRRQRLSYHNVRLSEELQRHKKTSSNPSCSQSAAAVTAAADDAKGFPLTDQVPQSDAVLNCPACMTILCRDCQRHEVFHSQYRAMFVVNCTTVTEERLTYTHKPDKKSRKRRHHQQQQPLQEGDLYYPVRCTHCNTEVAVYDNDEVYHFFNVLASAP